MKSRIPIQMHTYALHFKSIVYTIVKSIRYQIISDHITLDMQHSASCSTKLDQNDDQPEQNEMTSYP